MEHTPPAARQAAAARPALDLAFAPIAAPPEPEPAPAASPRVWRHGGVWTGGVPARVRTVG
jgi:hypothetical protein